MSEDERWLLTVDLYSAGVMLAGHRYEMPEEVSLLLRAMKKIPAGRFNYSESQLDEAEVRRKFGRRTAAKVGVIFDGEKANVCVRGERFALERTLKLGR